MEPLLNIRKNSRGEYIYDSMGCGCCSSQYALHKSDLESYISELEEELKDMRELLKEF